MADREPLPIVRTLAKIAAILAIAGGLLTLGLAIMIYKTFASLDPIVAGWIGIIVFPLGAVGFTMVAVGIATLLSKKTPFQRFPRGRG